MVKKWAKKGNECRRLVSLRSAAAQDKSFPSRWWWERRSLNSVGASSSPPVPLPRLSVPSIINVVTNGSARPFARSSTYSSWRFSLLPRTRGRKEDLLFHEAVVAILDVRLLASDIVGLASSKWANLSRKPIRMTTGPHPALTKVITDPWFWRGSSAGGHVYYNTMS